MLFKYVHTVYSTGPPSAYLDGARSMYRIKSPSHAGNTTSYCAHHQVADRLAQGAVELPPLHVQRHIVVAVGELHHRRVVLVEAGVVHGVPAELLTTTHTHTKREGSGSSMVGGMRVCQVGVPWRAVTATGRQAGRESKKR